jgi:hypothetical protein
VTGRRSSIYDLRDKITTVLPKQLGSGDNRPAFESDAVMDAREVFTANWRLQPSKRPGAKAISSRLGDLCGRVIHGAQVWPSDDPSGFQSAEWRIAQHIDRKNQPRYTLVPPRGT